MPLVFNGVTIPENVANALMVNGVSITQVIANGVEVWKQALFNAAWSGDSLIGTTIKVGIQTSGSLYRYASTGGTLGYTGTYQDYGVWLTATSEGLGSGTSRVGYTPSAGVVMYSGFTTTPSTWAYVSDTNTAPIITFTKGSGFSGTSVMATPGNASGFETSGGLIRYHTIRSYTTENGAWVSLT